jgi:hypothetical protein
MLTRKRFENRKGDIAIETLLGTVVAIGGIILLIILGVKLYNFFVSQEERNAQESLQGLIGKIDNLEDGESNTFIFQGIENWILVGWGKEIKPSEKPEKCFFDSCICIVNKEHIKELGLIPGTQEKGFCRKLDRKVEVSSKAYYDINNAVRSKKGDYLYRCIELDGILSSVSVNKTLDKYEIILDYGVIESDEASKKIPKLNICKDLGYEDPESRDKTPNIDTKR